MNDQQVILVDETDEVLGTMEKLEAHTKGLLHRAFSIFIFNSKNEMLLQQRAFAKYHSAGLWSNACCSHPHPGEDTEAAAQRRLKEELGFRTALQKVFDFTYSALFENGLTENEFDHVFVGKSDGEIKINPEEVHDYSFVSMKELKNQLKENPRKFTAWLHVAFPRIEDWWNQNLENDK
jgi:isopentenyl-diphosphate delta-isomerase